MFALARADHVDPLAATALVRRLYDLDPRAAGDVLREARGALATPEVEDAFTQAERDWTRLVLERDQLGALYRRP